MISRTLAIAFVVSVIGGVFLDTSGAFVVGTSGVVVVAIRISLALKVILYYSRGYSLHEAEKLPLRGLKTSICWMIWVCRKSHLSGWALALVRRNFALGFAIRSIMAALSLPEADASSPW